MSIREVRIPDIGDAENVEVIEICVQRGDVVEVDDALIVIESDKASMELPAPFAGTVQAIAVSLGDQVDEGDIVMSLEVAGEGADAADAPGEAAEPEVAADEAEAEAEAEADETEAEAVETEAEAEETVAEADETEAEADETDADADAGEAEAAKPGTEEADEAETIAAAKRADAAADADGADEDRADADGADAGGGGERRVEVRVPDIGEAKDVVVIEVAVSAGQEVVEDDLLVVVESDKASLEIPSPHAGEIEEVAVAEGDEVDEGTLLVVMRTRAAAADGSSEDKESEAKPAAEIEDEPEMRQQSPETEAAASGVATARGSGSEDETERGAPARPASALESGVDDAGSGGAQVYAGPAVRRLARELGVELTAVKGSGAKGRIVKDDVKAYVKTRLKGGETGAGGAAMPSVAVIDFEKFGAIETVPLTRIRRRGARNLHASWLNVVHVTQHDEADVTELELFRKSLATDAEKRELKLTPLPFIMKVCQHMLQEHPNFNASLDAVVENLIRKQYFNIGFAVDTEEGLVVPVVRDVDRKGVWQLAAEIMELSELARNRKLKPDHLQGGCFTISSLGAIGGTGFTPIVNAPEVAILGVARLTTKPVWNGDEFRPRAMLPLSLSYDHRAINGAEAGRFMVQLCAALADVRRLIL